MTETHKKHDKPDDPPYSGGEDEGSQKQKTNPARQGGNDFPVDESDDGPGGGDDTGS